MTPFFHNSGAIKRGSISAKWPEVRGWFPVSVLLILDTCIMEVSKQQALAYFFIKFHYTTGSLDSMDMPILGFICSIRNSPVQ